MPDLDLSEVARIATEAGRIADGRCGSDYATWEKVPGHPVCDVDLEVDSFLNEHLRALDPEAGWLSEERVDSGMGADRSPASPSAADVTGCPDSERITARSTVF